MVSADYTTNRLYHNTNKKARIFLLHYYLLNSSLIGGSSCIDPCIGVDVNHCQCPTESKDVFHYTEGRYYNKQFLRENADKYLIHHYS